MTCFTGPLSNVVEREDPAQSRLIFPFPTLLKGDNTVAPAAWRHRDTQVSDRIEDLVKQGESVSLKTFFITLTCLSFKNDSAFLLVDILFL